MRSIKLRQRLDVSQIPTVQQFESELSRVRYRQRFSKILKSTVFTLITVAAIAVLISTLLMPVFQIYGSSMTPTLEDGQIVVSVQTGDFQSGDLIVFRYNNKVLVKRVIATPGQWVNIDKDGNVYVDNKLLEEPYLSQKSLGECNIKLPCQVPESRLFVMGDHRSVSVDSRSTSVGCISEDQIVGKILLRVWPLNKFGTVN